MLKRRLFIVLLLALGLVACTTAEPESAELTRISVPMGFVADPQYAPFYVADSKGYFAEEGLEIEFDYSFETDGIALVGANERPLAVVSGDQVILARAQELPVVYVMEWFQRYPVAIVSKAESGIATAEDLAGRNVGLPGFFGTSYVGLVGLLSANGLTLEDIDANDIGFNQVESLVTDQSEAVVVYLSNEPIQLADRGVDINIIPVDESIDLVANGVISNETVIAENPELVQGFVRALLRGLADTIADPAEAYEISKEYVEGLDDSRRAVLDASIELWTANTLGVTEPASWERTQDVLLQMGFLEAPLEDLDEIYTNRFVEAGQP